MAKRGNPNWGKMIPSTTLGLPAVTEFQRAAQEFNLRPGDYEGSARLQQWARMNLNKVYIPENLLRAWGLHPDEVAF